MKNAFFLRCAFALLILQALVLPVSLLAQTSPTRDEIYAAIRKEENENSKIMHAEHILTDLYGPRLTGSPNHVNAAKWIKNELDSWGFVNTKLEPWEFGHVGWVNDRNTGLMLSPVADTLTYEVLAWTPSTKGPVQADAVSILLPDRPTQEELTAYLDSVKAKVAGKIVLVGKPTFIDQSKDPAPKHLTDEELKRRLDIAGATAQNPNRPQPSPTPTPRPGTLTGLQIGEQVDKFLVDNGVLVRINESQLDRGAVRAFGLWAARGCGRAS